MRLYQQNSMNSSPRHNKKLKKLQWLRQDKDIYQTSACSELNLFSILDLFNKVPVS